MKRINLLDLDIDVLRAMHIAGSGASATDICRIAGLELVNEQPTGRFQHRRSRLVKARLVGHTNVKTIITWDVTDEGRAFLAVIDGVWVGIHEERRDRQRLGIVQTHHRNGSTQEFQVTWAPQASTPTQEDEPLVFNLRDCKAIRVEDLSVTITFLSYTVTLGAQGSQLAERVAGLVQPSSGA